MTLRQEAHGLIDRMPEESVRVLIPVMAKLIPFRRKATQTTDKSPKMQAFLEMQEMLKESAKYDISMDQYEGLPRARFLDYGIRNEP